MNEPEPLPGEISASQQNLLNRVCDEFEAQWKGGNSPRLEDYLARAPAVDRPAFLRELLALELSYLTDRDDQPRADDYFHRFAEHSDTISGVFEEFGARASSRRPTNDLSGVPHGAPHAAPENELHPGPSAEGSTSYYHAIEPGVVIGGRFKLVNRIGEGGMGEVWVAKQSEPVKRKVAVKLIKSGMDSKAVVARFEHERQALAMMDHPNIARVLDGGITPDGRPYFVMELVNGLPLTKFCDEAKLTPRERLELFVPVCQAVQHAHQKAIVHRDLKPSNVLVTVHDGKPVPKVIDFGVAKATGGKLTDDTLSTQFGAVVGTLEYMSPEQAGYSSTDIDTRADIYSLGVILYELLTGLRPLDSGRLRKAALTEMIRIIREEEPLRPSNRLSTDEALPSLAALRQTEPKRLMAILRGELDWVVMRCLEKDRNRRYDTANGLARDIQHYLADEPVEARPPSAGYKLRKFIRRNKTGLAAATLVMAALVAGTAVSVWQAIRATNALESERQTRAVLDQERTQLNGKISDVLVDLVGRREKARAAGTLQGKQLADMQDASQRADALASSELADPALVERVRALLGLIRQDEKDWRVTTRLETIRLDYLVAKLGTSAPSDIGIAFAAAFREFGIPATELAAAEAGSHVRDSSVREVLLAGLDAWSVWDSQASGREWKHLLTIAQAADDDPWRRECRNAVLRGDRPSLLKMACRDDSPRQPAEAVLLLAGFLAVPPHDRAVTDEELAAASGLLEKAEVWHPGDAKFEFGQAALSLGKHREVNKVALARESVKQLKENGASPEILAAAYSRLGQLLADKKDSTDAAAAFRQAVRLMPGRAEYRALLIALIRFDKDKVDELIAECSDWIQSGPPDPSPYRERGRMYMSRKQWPEALADFIKLTELSPGDANAWSLRGDVHRVMRQHDQALATATKAIEVAQAARQNPARYWYSRAVVHRELGQLDEAIADSTQAIELDPKNGSYWAFRGDWYCKQGDLQKALSDYEMAVKNPSRGNPGIGLYRRGELNERIGKWDRAISDWTEYLRYDPSNQYARETLFRLLITCPDRAIRDPRRALEMDHENELLFANKPEERWQLLGIAYFQLDEWKEASEALTKVPDNQLGAVGVYLALAHWHMGNHDDAKKCYDRAIPWMDSGQPNDDDLRQRWAEAAELLGSQKKGR